MSTILIENRESLSRKLRENGIESAQVHYRNDRYSIFGGRNEGKYPKMDSIEDKYLVIPMHTKMSLADVTRVCNVIKSGW
jgi:dTDP-4-amino-4,6-dideoxygalactose transaminase